MSIPVTRGELREELSIHRNEVREELTIHRNDVREELTIHRKEVREELTIHRKEVREELVALEQRIDHKFDMWGGALLARIESGERRLEQRLEAMATRTEMFAMEQRLQQHMGSMLQQQEQRLLVELARHVRAIQEAVSTQIRTDADLPGRVARLEDK